MVTKTKINVQGENFLALFWLFCFIGYWPENEVVMRRNELVAYRVNEKEKHEIEMLSQLHGMSKSALIRSLVKREVEDQAYIVEDCFKECGSGGACSLNENWKMKARIKKELENIENKIAPGDEIHIKVDWRNDDLYAWDLPGGSIELISEEEYLKRGGLIIRYPEEESSKRSEKSS